MQKISDDKKKVTKSFYLIEKYLPGNYEKYCNNLSYMNEKYKLDAIMAFAHFSYEFSKGNWMVMDL